MTPQDEADLKMISTRIDSFKQEIASYFEAAKSGTVEDRRDLIAIAKATEAALRGAADAFAKLLKDHEAWGG